MPDNFIESYINHTQIYESPKSFWKWSAYSTISTLLRDKCYIKLGAAPLFPNLYVLFLAGSSYDRKNKPIELSEKLVKKVGNVRIISGRHSAQAVLDELAHTETDGRTGYVMKSNSGTFFATEFTGALVKDPEGIKIFTDLYDHKEEYSHRLRSGHHFSLKSPVFSMLCASNAAMLNGIFDESVIRGGFLARIMLVAPDEWRVANALVRDNSSYFEKGEGLLLEKLKRIAQIVGEFKFEEAAIEEYEGWYKPFRESYKDVKEVTGIVGRIHTHVLKLAMILAANDLTQCIRKVYIEEAIVTCLDLLQNYRIYTMNNAKTPIGQIAGTLITCLYQARNYFMMRKDVIRLNWQNFDVELMDKAIVQLEEAKMLVQHQTKDGLGYQLTQACVDIIQKGGGGKSGKT